MARSRPRWRYRVSSRRQSCWPRGLRRSAGWWRLPPHRLHWPSTPSTFPAGRVTLTGSRWRQARSRAWATSAWPRPRDHTRSSYAWSALRCGPSAKGCLCWPLLSSPVCWPFPLCSKGIPSTGSGQSARSRSQAAGSGDPARAKRNLQSGLR